MSGWNNSSLSLRNGTTSGLLSTRTPQGVGTTGGGIPNPSIGIGTTRLAMPRNAMGSWVPSRSLISGATTSPLYATDDPNDPLRLTPIGGLGPSNVVLDSGLFYDALVLVGYEVVNGRKMMRVWFVEDATTTVVGLDNVEGILNTIVIQTDVPTPILVAGVEIIEEGVTERPVVYVFHPNTYLFEKIVTGFPGGDPPGDGSANGHIHAMVMLGGNDIWAFGHTGFGTTKIQSAAYKLKTDNKIWEAKNTDLRLGDIRAALPVNGGNIWVSGLNGTAVWNGTTWTPHYPPGGPENLDTIIVDNNSNLVIASSSSNRLFQWSGTAWDDITSANPLPSGLVGLRVYGGSTTVAISGTIGGAGIVYFASNGNGWVRFTGLPSASGAFVPQHWIQIDEFTVVIGGSAANLP